VKKLPVKAQVVLAFLQESGGEFTCQQISNEIEKKHPCPDCEGSGRSGTPGERRCARCFGRGIKFFGYSVAYQALQQLKARGLVAKRNVTDEWGDVTPKLVWQAVEPVRAEGSSVDDLESLWKLPTVAEPERS
jgi:hypothetical protein